MCITILGTWSVAFATVEENPLQEEKAANYSSTIVTLSISGGVATCYGKITGITGKTTKTSVHLYLQKYNKGTWENVKDWSSSGNTASRTLSKEQKVSKGYKYRVKRVFKAYAGSKCEKSEKYSASEKY